MSGGQKIDDHSFWAGGASKEGPFPTGNKVKHESSADGFGAMSEYEDTTEKIRAQQESSKRKVASNPMKPGHRN